MDKSIIIMFVVMLIIAFLIIFFASRTSRKHNQFQGTGKEARLENLK